MKVLPAGLHSKCCNTANKVLALGRHMVCSLLVLLLCAGQLELGQLQLQLQAMSQSAECEARIPICCCYLACRRT
jgi:hypothetical protein